ARRIRVTRLPPFPERDGPTPDVPRDVRHQPAAITPEVEPAVPGVGQQPAATAPGATALALVRDAPAMASEQAQVDGHARSPGERASELTPAARQAAVDVRELANAEALARRAVHLQAVAGAVVGLPGDQVPVITALTRREPVER